MYLGADVNWTVGIGDMIWMIQVLFRSGSRLCVLPDGTVTIEPAAYWNINDDRSKFGLKVGFGFYF